MRGMEELRSPAAIPALIHSLQPSDAKAESIRKCLARYRLSTLPTEPGSPGRLCDPDVFARQYLGNLTGIQEDHLHDWWSRWWSENGAKLRWSPETGSFKLP